jgi:hypothetical protein
MKKYALILFPFLLVSCSAEWRMARICRNNPELCKKDTIVEVKVYPRRAVVLPIIDSTIRFKSQKLDVFEITLRKDSVVIIEIPSSDTQVVYQTNWQRSPKDIDSIATLSRENKSLKSRVEKLEKRAKNSVPKRTLYALSIMFTFIVVVIAIAIRAVIGR